MSLSGDNNNNQTSIPAEGIRWTFLSSHWNSWTSRIAIYRKKAQNEWLAATDGGRPVSTPPGIFSPTACPTAATTNSSFTSSPSQLSFPSLGHRFLLLLFEAITMITCCCCWPVHRCVAALSLLDTFIVGYFAYKSVNVFIDNIYESHWIIVLTALFFTGFLICQILGTVFVILAHRQNNARYCYPRLTLLVGLVITSLVVFGIVMMYFMGAQKSMNQFFFSVYEWFFEEVLDEKEKIELKGELRLYAVGFLLLTLTFAVYSAFELLLTRKFYLSLARFEPVPQNEPTAPLHPAFNPEYANPPPKVYPNVA